MTLASSKGVSHTVVTFDKNQTHKIALLRLFVWTPPNLVTDVVILVSHFPRAFPIMTHCFDFLIWSCASSTTFLIRGNGVYAYTIELLCFSSGQLLSLPQRPLSKRLPALSFAIFFDSFLSDGRMMRATKHSNNLDNLSAICIVCFDREIEWSILLLANLNAYRFSSTPSPLSPLFVDSLDGSSLMCVIGCRFYEHTSAVELTTDANRIATNKTERYPESQEEQKRTHGRKKNDSMLKMIHVIAEADPFLVSCQHAS